MNNINNAIRRQHRLIAPLIFTFLIWTIISADSVQAQDWGFDPMIKIGGEVDDNALLRIRTDEELKLEGYLVEASVGIDYASPLTSFSVTPRVLLRRYPDNPEFESTDTFVRSLFRHDMRSSSIGFRGNYQRQQVRIAERADTDLLIDDPDEISDDDSGQVGIEGTREKWRFTPNWAYQFTNKSSIAANLDYFDVHYEDVFANLLNDWNDIRANLSYRYALSDITTAVLTATGRRYETADGLTETIGYGLLAGFDKSVSEKTRLRAMVGVESTEPETGANIDEKFTNVVGNISLTRKLETIRILAQYRRSVIGSGLGNLSLRDALYMNFTRQLNERISAGMGFRAYHDEGLSDTSRLDRDYFQVRTVFTWHLSKAFALEFDYRYTLLNREGLVAGERANSNHVVLWFVYQPNRI